jgi:GT2 family glycosyltransferase
MVKVLMIIVTYQAEKWLDYCLEHTDQYGDHIDVAVVDNNSTDGTREMLRSDRFDGVKYRIFLNENLGFGKAHNVIFNRKDLLNEYEYLLLLNQDASITPTELNALLGEAISDRKVGIWSPLHYCKEGVLDRNFTKYMEKGMKRPHSENQIEVAFVNAAIWLVNKNVVLEIGGFNPAFSHYGEDVNFAQRTRKMGYTIVINTAVKAFHWRNQDYAMGANRSPFFVSVSNLGRLLNPNKNYLKAIAETLLDYYREIKGKKRVVKITHLKKLGELLLKVPSLIKYRGVRIADHTDYSKVILEEILSEETTK